MCRWAQPKPFQDHQMSDMSKAWSDAVHPPRMVAPCQGGFCRHLCPCLGTRQDISVLSSLPGDLLGGWVRAVLGWHATCAAWSTAVHSRVVVALCQGSFCQHLCQLLVARMPFSAPDRTSVCHHPPPPPPHPEDVLVRVEWSCFRTAF